MGKPSEVHAELLRRASATGLSDREIEKQVPLAQAFIAKARKGGNDSARAEIAWEKLAAWLDARQAPAATAIASAPVASPSPATPAPTAARQADDKARAELVRSMKAARTLEDLDLVSALLFEGIDAGWVEGSKSNRYVQVIEQRRKNFATRLEEEARKAATAPRTIEVVYVQDWRPIASSSPPTPASPPA